MFRNVSTVQSLALAAVLSLGVLVPSADAQVSYARSGHRAEFTPFGSYQWGGTFDTDASATIANGELNEQDSFSWGVIMSFMAQRNSAVELWYLRQDTDVKFNPTTGDTRTVGDLSNNYIQLGVRQDLMAGERLKPFITASMGINILDPKGDLSSSTRFAWTLGGGAKIMAANNRVGFRFDARWMVTPVPSGTYGGWCSVWGCYAVEGTDWLHQGQLGGGIIFAF